MLYWIIIGVLIVGIIAVIFFTVSKLLKEKKDYNQFERRYHSREDDYDDDYDDDDDEEDDYEPEPRRRPARQQSECRTSFSTGEAPLEDRAGGCGPAGSVQFYLL
ncbi:MAG: hypothetical protein ACLRZ8_03895 [Blautia sp.]